MDKRPDKNHLIKRTLQARQNLWKKPTYKDADIIELTGGGPLWEPFGPAVEAAANILDRDDIMHKYHRTIGTFKDTSLPEYFESLGVVLPGGKPIDSNKNLVFGAGATQLYAAIVQDLLTPKDVLVVPVPTYGFFISTDNLKGRRIVPLYLRAEDDYRLTPEYLDQELTRINSELAAETPPKRANAFLHLNPHNPTGVVHDKAETEALAKIMRKHDIGLVIDDMAYLGMEYARASTNGRIAAPMSSAEGMFNRTVTITSLSKAYSAVDLRAGVALGPENYIKKIARGVQRITEFTSTQAQIAMHETFKTSQKKARDQYLSDHADFLTKGSYMIRVLVNGWENDAEARDYFENDWNHFLKEMSGESPKTLKGCRYDVVQNMEITNIKAEEERDKIRNSPDLLDEAAPYLYDEIEQKTQRKLLEYNKESRRLTEAADKQLLAKELKHGIPGIKTVNSCESGFFMLLDASKLKGKYYGTRPIRGSTDLTRLLSSEIGVNLLSGDAMGSPEGNMLLRLSFPENATLKMLTAFSRIRTLVGVLCDKPGPLPEQNPLCFNR